MPDIFSRDKRSQIMSRITGKDTKPEIRVRKYLFLKGFRYRKNDKRYSGKPDIVLPKYRTIIFINGCFWHGHYCKKGKLPETRKNFWKSKIQKNKTRDKKVYATLKKQNWKVIVIWTCQISTNDKFEKLMLKIIERIKT
ncbi:MAG: DNA mismatch endonuclease Vsr [Candidatus Lokiarchaeota archaeon]|nr:DNA mismatch endonuclease Vsr [Candidatus Lokiarchaeota archaeon]